MGNKLLLLAFLILLVMGTLLVCAVLATLITAT
jgi:hypothetical protein